jgi:hypothetical protein
MKTDRSDAMIAVTYLTPALFAAKPQIGIPILQEDAGDLSASAPPHEQRRRPRVAQTRKPGEALCRRHD